MFKHYFEQIKSVEVYPVISLIIFVSFFVGLLVYVALMKKPHIERMNNMPLQDDVPTNTNHSSFTSKE
ncbi:MAG: cbb3-type cytochrome c oxidase subunit 3 [Microscillaceae bacterium]|nr:cbb3-type cytochrome c oxidase subunit 3 [Microscillaceae bacterium]MDW8460114.1 cbb3-type cytochrome c oxidase subunit 3 [Cytophagales bacterium]